MIRIPLPAAPVAVAFLCAAPFLVWAYSGGPPTRRSGAPGDRSCIDAACHAGTRIDDSANLSLDTGTNLTYVPGGPRQRWIVRNTDRLARAYGFQLSARLASNPENGQAGDLMEVNSKTQVVCENQQLRGANGCVPKGLLQFVQHNDPHAEGQFDFDWTPPVNNVGDIHVHVASNASVAGQRNSRIHLRRFVVRSGPHAVNAASLGPVVSAGSWVTIFGSKLAASTRSWRADDFRDGMLPLALDGVSVTVNRRPAAIAYISPNQVNFQAPADSTLGELPVQILQDGRVTFATTIQNAIVAPAVFAFEQEDRRYAAAAHANGDPAAKSGLLGAGTSSRPCRPGEVIVLYGTGFGDTDPRIAPGRTFQGAAPVTSPVQVWVGGLAAPVQFAGLIGVGLYQFNIVVPDLPAGDHSIQAEREGVKSQDRLFLTVIR